MDQEKLGRLEIELRRDLCPLTCENFRQLITGERGTIRETDEHGNSRCINLHYKGSRMCRVKAGFALPGRRHRKWQRDVESEHLQARRLPGREFHPEHTGGGCLSCKPRPGFQRVAQFFFTFAAKPEWDERHVVFGVLRNRESLRTLFAIDQVGDQFEVKARSSSRTATAPPHHTQQKKKFTSTSSERLRRPPLVSC